MQMLYYGLQKKKIGTGKFEKVGMYCLLHILL